MFREKFARKFLGLSTGFSHPCEKNLPFSRLNFITRAFARLVVQNFVNKTSFPQRNKLKAALPFNFQFSAFSRQGKVGEWFLELFSVAEIVVFFFPSSSFYFHGFSRSLLLRWNDGNFYSPLFLFRQLSANGFPK